MIQAAPNVTSTAAPAPVPASVPVARNAAIGFVPPSMIRRQLAPPKPVVNKPKPTVTAKATPAGPSQPTQSVSSAYDAFMAELEGLD